MAEYAQGWYPVQVPEFDQRLEELAAACEKRGRRIEDIDITLVTAISEQGQLAELKRKGVNRVVLSLPTEDADGCRRVLDGYAQVVEWGRALG